jgi:UDP-N-acetylglucosamine 2-epimerase (non-hydrolysing)
VKVLTVLGTRPEIIRLSLIIPALDRLCDQVLVHTGQNYDELLNKIFFRDLNVRAPDIDLGIRAESFGDQVGQIVARLETVLAEQRPDRVLILGDTNSGLAAYVARRMGIPVYHVEAGNRCFDDRVPEEINRRVIDHCSSVWLPYTERSRANLLREGIPGDRIHVVGNPIFEVLQAQRAGIESSTVHDRLGLRAGDYFLVTTHREENVDVEARLRAISNSLAQIHERYKLPVLWPIHPRTRRRLDEFGIEPAEGVRREDPLGLHDFVRLEKDARCVLSDSGTVQEECCIMRIPNVTLRDVTERPETVECGSNILAGVEHANVLRGVDVAFSRTPDWDPPREYLARTVSQTVANVVLGY